MIITGSILPLGQHGYILEVALTSDSSTRIYAAICTSDRIVFRIRRSRRFEPRWMTIDMRPRFVDWLINEFINNTFKLLDRYRLSTYRVRLSSFPPCSRLNMQWYINITHRTDWQTNLYETQYTQTVKKKNAVDKAHRRFNTRTTVSIVSFRSWYLIKSTEHSKSSWQ